MGANAFFLPAVLALGLVSTLQDFRIRRISNLWIILSLVYAVMVHLALFVSADQQEVFWFRQTFINVLASTLVAIYFWKQNWWGGGDAKLFIAYSALIPLSRYPFGYFSYYFASFLLLIITFVPAAIWAFLHAQFNLIKAGKGIYYNFRPGGKREFLQLSLGFTAIFFLSNLLTLILNQYCHWVKDFPLLVWFLSLGFYRRAFRLFQERFWLAAISWILGAWIIIFMPLFHQINIWRILTNSFFSWILVIILRRHIFKTIDYYVEWTKNNNMAFAGWMFLGALAVWFLKRGINAF